MTEEKHNKMTIEEKEEHYKNVIFPVYKTNNKEVPWFLEPDAFEGWK